MRLPAVASLCLLALAGCWLPSPSPGVVNELSGVTALSASDVWAVGGTGPTSKAIDQRPLVEHFDGQSWQLAPAPALSNGGQLSSIAGRSDNDLWAAGSRQVGSLSQAWVVRWNGSSWQSISLPVRRTDATVLTALSEGTDGTIAAVGENTSRHRPLVLLRGKTGWRQLPDPVVQQGTCAGSQLGVSGVSVATATQVWLSGNARGTCPVVMEWNGTRWVDRSPPVVYLGTTVEAVLALPAGRALVSGFNSTDNSDVGFVAAWDGRTWVQQPTTASNTESSIDGLSASGQDYWAEGWDNQAVVFHWVDGVWQEQDVQNDPSGASFDAVAAAGGHAFVVGSQDGQTLVDVR